MLYISPRPIVGSETVAEPSAMHCDYEYLLRCKSEIFLKIQIFLRILKVPLKPNLTMHLNSDGGLGHRLP